MFQQTLRNTQTAPVALNRARDTIAFEPLRHITLRSFADAADPVGPGWVDWSRNPPVAWEVWNAPGRSPNFNTKLL